MDLKVRVGKNQFMIWMAFLPKGSDWLCWRPAPKPFRKQPKARTTTLGIQGPPKKRREDRPMDAAEPAGGDWNQLSVESQRAYSIFRVFQSPHPPPLPLQPGEHAAFLVDAQGDDAARCRG